MIPLKLIQMVKPMPNRYCLSLIPFFFNLFFLSKSFLLASFLCMFFLSKQEDESLVKL